MATKLWKHYLVITTQSIVAIYLASFCLGIFFVHRGDHWAIPAVILGVLYAFVLVVSVQRIVKELPMAALMIAAPTVPLIILLLLVTMLPILQML
jgi:hypothetical protein